MEGLSWDGESLSPLPRIEEELLRSQWKEQ